MWRGVGATDEEMAASRHVAGFLGGNPSQVAEGKEPGEPLFYSASNQAALDATQANVTLFRFLLQLIFGLLWRARRSTRAHTR